MWVLFLAFNAEVRDAKMCDELSPIFKCNYPCYNITGCSEVHEVEDAPLVWSHYEASCQKGSVQDAILEGCLVWAGPACCTSLFTCVVNVLSRDLWNIFTGHKWSDRLGFVLGHTIYWITLSKLVNFVQPVFACEKAINSWNCEGFNKMCECAGYAVPTGGEL